MPQPTGLPPPAGLPLPLPGLPSAQDHGLPPMTATGVGGGVGMGGGLLPSVSMALSASPAAANHFGAAFPPDGSRDHESLCVICIDARCPYMDMDIYIYIYVYICLPASTRGARWPHLLDLLTLLTCLIDLLTLLTCLLTCLLDLLTLLTCLLTCLLDLLDLLDLLTLAR